MMNFLQGMYLKSFNLFDGVKDSFVQVTMLGIFFLCVLFIAGIIFLVVKILQKKELSNAIYLTVLAVVFSCFLMVPLTLSFNKLMQVQVKKMLVTDLDKVQVELKNNRLENEKIKLENQLEEEKLKKNIEGEEYRKQIELLKASQVSVANFHNILEVGLLEMPLHTKQVWMKKGELQKASSLNLFYDYYQDEFLAVNTYDIDAKFGIDLKKIKIKKVSKDKIQVAGIEPHYTGSKKNIKNKLITEVREVRYKKGKTDPVDAVVKLDGDSVTAANKFEADNDKDYQEALENMKQSPAVSKAVTKLGENFIKMIFAPVYADIEFVEKDDETFMDIRTYINTELANYNEQMKGVLKPAGGDTALQEQPF